MGMTRSTFAGQIGAAAIAVQFWECNRRLPNSKFNDRIRRLAELNGIDVEQVTDQDYYHAKLEMHVGMEPPRVALEKLERIVKAQEEADAVV